MDALASGADEGRVRSAISLGESINRDVDSRISEWGNLASSDM